ncbi:MAG: hypothetical protein R3F60_29620 [bacterium]
MRSTLWLLLLLVSSAAARPGPVPDYAPLALIRTHVQAMDLSPEFVERLSSIAGRRHTVIGDEDTLGTMVWLRDYQPIYVRDAQSHLHALRVKSLLPERNGLKFAGDPPAEDLPLVHENGNLVVAGRYIFVSDRLFEDNDVEAPESQGERRPLLRDLARALNRPEADIVLMPQLPGEGTGHVDLYLLPVADDLVLVPSIAEEALVDLTEGEWILGRVAADFLDEQARFLTRLGLTVRRLPMLPPRLMPAVDRSAEDAVFFSPANSLLVNVAGRRTVLIPDIDASALRSGHRRLYQQYRKQWARTFQGVGWKPVFADATELSRYLGFFRCLSAVVPE